MSFAESLLSDIAFTHSNQTTLDRCYPSPSYFASIQTLTNTLTHIGFKCVNKHSFSYQRPGETTRCEGTNLWAAATFDMNYSQETSSSSSSHSSAMAMLPVMILGAHYDTIADTNGFDDNASGVACVLQTCKHWMERYVQAREQKQPMRFGEKNFTQSFVLMVCLFDAEEYGLFGSKAFASHPPASVKRWVGAQWEHVYMMINVDSLFFGDDLHCYGNHKNQKILDQVLTHPLVSSFLKTNPKNPLYNPFGYRMVDDSSDHAPFDEKGVPVIHIEATNWFAGPPHYGGMTQSLANGSVWDTPNDNLKYILKTKKQQWKDCIETRLHQTECVIDLFFQFCLF